MAALGRFLRDLGAPGVEMEPLLGPDWSPQELEAFETVRKELEAMAEIMRKTKEENSDP